MKKHFNFLLVMLVAIAMFAGSQLIVKAQGPCPIPNVSITDTNHHSVEIPAGYANKCYYYPPQATGAHYPIGDYTLSVFVPVAGPDIAVHLSNLRQGNFYAFVAMTYDCDTIYTYTWHENTVLEGLHEFRVHSTQGGFVAVLSASLLDTITVKVNAVDEPWTAPVAFLCPNEVGIADPIEQGADIWHHIDLRGIQDERTYLTPLQPGLYANQYGRKILVQ